MLEINVATDDFKVDLILEGLTKLYRRDIEKLVLRNMSVFTEDQLVELESHAPYRPSWLFNDTCRCIGNDLLLPPKDKIMQELEITLENNKTKYIHKPENPAKLSTMIDMLDSIHSFISQMEPDDLRQFPRYQYTIDGFDRIEVDAMHAMGMFLLFSYSREEVEIGNKFLFYATRAKENIEPLPSVFNYRTNGPKERK